MLLPALHITHRACGCLQLPAPALKGPPRLLVQKLKGLKLLPSQAGWLCLL